MTPHPTRAAATRPTTRAHKMAAAPDLPAPHRRCFATVLYQDLKNTLRRRPFHEDIAMLRLWASRMLAASSLPIFIMHAAIDPVEALGALANVTKDQTCFGGRLYLQQVPLIRGPTRGDWTHYRHVYTKLHAWNLPCDQVTFLDYDVIPLREGVDRIFDLCETDDLCGTQDTTTPKPPKLRLINAGVMVLRPNRTRLERWLELIADENRRGVSRALSEQGFLRTHHPNWRDLPFGWHLPQYFGWAFWPRANVSAAIAWLRHNDSYFAHLKLAEMRPQTAEALNVRWQWIVLYCQAHNSTLCRKSQARYRLAETEVMATADCSGGRRLLVN